MKRIEIRKARKIFHINKNNHVIHEMIDPEYSSKKEEVVEEVSSEE